MRIYQVPGCADAVGSVATLWRPVKTAFEMPLEGIRYE